MACKIKKFRFQTTIGEQRLPFLNNSFLVIVPIVNVFFLLLIFFIIGSTLVFQTGITVNLPEIKQEYKSVPYKLVITLTKEKLLFFNDQRLENLQQLEKALANATYSQENQPVQIPTTSDSERSLLIIIKADRDVLYDDIVKITAIARKFSLNVFLVTKSDAT